MDDQNPAEKSWMKRRYRPTWGEMWSVTDLKKIDSTTELNVAKTNLRPKKATRLSNTLEENQIGGEWSKR